MNFPPAIVVFCLALTAATSTSYQVQTYWALARSRRPGRPHWRKRRSMGLLVTSSSYSRPRVKPILRDFSSTYWLLLGIWSGADRTSL